MGYIGRLTKRVEPYAVTLQPRWQELFKPSRKADPEFSIELLASIEGWLKFHVVTQKIQRETLVPAKAVKKSLSVIEAKVLHSCVVATLNILKYQNEEDGVMARAHNVALDWIICGLPTAHSLFSGGGKPNPGDAERHLDMVLQCVNGHSQLKGSVAGQSKHFSLDENEQRQRLSMLEGRRLPNGVIFSYKPDPRQRSHARPGQAALDILAAALRDIYRCTGSPPHVPRNESKTSPFLRFLEAARLSLPIGYQTELVSPARRAENDEKKHGPGTLERFKSRLYHPDCWRT